MRWLLPLAALALTACEDRPADPAEQANVDANATAAPAATPTGGAVRSRAEAQGIPARFIGVWDYIDGRCDPASDLRMEISSRRIVFYESVGDVTAVEVANDNSVTVAMNLSGEGETWSEKLKLDLSENGRRLVPSGAGGDAGYEPMPRKRCES